MLCVCYQGSTKFKHVPNTRRKSPYWLDCQKGLPPPCDAGADVLRWNRCFTTDRMVTGTTTGVVWANFFLTVIGLGGMGLVTPAPAWFPPTMEEPNMVYLKALDLTGAASSDWDTLGQCEYLTRGWRGGEGSPFIILTLSLPIFIFFSAVCAKNGNFSLQ